MERLILDTGLLVAGARDRLSIAAVVGERDAAMPAVVVAEYLAGVELTSDEDRQAAQRSFLDAVLSVTPVIDYTAVTAEHHALLLAHVRRTGRPRGHHDLIIAATARATDRTILTRDARARFDELPGVSAWLVPAAP